MPPHVNNQSPRGGQGGRRSLTSVSLSIGRIIPKIFRSSARRSLSSTGTLVFGASAVAVGGGLSLFRNDLFPASIEQSTRVRSSGGMNGNNYNDRRHNSPGDMRGGKSNQLMTVSQGLLGLNILMYGLQVATQDAITAWGAKVNQLIVAGQYWRLITPAFFHGNLMHLAVNCYSLYNIAPALERLCGSKRLVVTYMVAAVAGNIASFYGSAAPSLGASGAVFGLGGALAMYFYQNKSLYGKRSDYVLKQLWQTLLINMAYGFANPRIDNWGHAGGLVGGAVVAYMLGPTLKLIETKSGKRYLTDCPPIPLLANPPVRIS